MAIRLLYHLYGKHDPDPAKDLYRRHHIFRKFYAIGNASEEKRAIVPRIRQKGNEYLLERIEPSARATGQLANWLAEHDDAEFLRERGRQRRGARMRRLVDRIVKAHPRVAQPFSVRRGVELMTLDGKIMSQILRQFADVDTPAGLGIHRRRSVPPVRRRICPANDDRRLPAVHRLGFSPVIH